MNKQIIRKTPLGAVVLIWKEFRLYPKIIRLILPKPGISANEQAYQLYPDSAKSSCEKIDTVAFSIRGLLEGDDVKISLAAVDLSVCSAFQKSVLEAQWKIPRGRVSTYRLIARQVGNSKAARAVGTALAHNPFPLIVPCHRTIRSDRSIGGFQGGMEQKRMLLEIENILFDAQQRVVCEDFFYNQN
ncbi:MAG: MGMT family protein [Desulfobacterales bacterium]